MKRDEIKEQDNTSHKASSTVRSEPVRVSASETNKGKKEQKARRMITAIMFGSAARRCSGENIITRYQMTVLVRRFLPKPSCSRTVADGFPAASEN
jgi:hypothetical protein